jgi:hypothetical protein
MGKLELSWANEFSNIGWKPDDLYTIVNLNLEHKQEEVILGAIITGDRTGELISVTLSKVENEKRIENTLLGFTIGGDNSIKQRDIISPRDRITGSLIITQSRFFVYGKVIQEIPFANIIITKGSRNTVAGSNYDLQKLGEIEYAYSGDIYISKIRMNKQMDLNNGYDEFTIAVVIGDRNPNPLEEALKKIERLISL